MVGLQLHPVLTDPVPPMPTRRITDRSVCIRHTGDSVIVFNGRGMIRPPPRSIYVSRGAVTDSLLISIAGRVRRNYRRFRLGK